MLPDEWDVLIEEFTQAFPNFSELADVLHDHFALNAMGDGRVAWTQRVPSEVQALHLAADGRIVIAAHADGTVRSFTGGSVTTVGGEVMIGTVVG